MSVSLTVKGYIVIQRVKSNGVCRMFMAAGMPTAYMLFTL